MSDEDRSYREVDISTVCPVCHRKVRVLVIPNDTGRWRTPGRIEAHYIEIRVNQYRGYDTRLDRRVACPLSEAEIEPSDEDEP